MELQTTDIIPGYNPKYFKEASDVMKKVRGLTDEYAQTDNLYDMDGMETIKRKLTAQMELLADHYARVKKYKTIGDYLEEQRKALKSTTITKIVAEKKMSANQAEKVVYEHKYYQERMEMLLSIRGFFIKVETRYERAADTLNNIRQSISLCRKDPNFQPVEE